MSKELFGTDGIRGKAGAYPLDAATVYACGRALGDLLGGHGRALLGMDTRESGVAIAEFLAAGLQDKGVETVLAGVLPTPGVSYLTASGGFDLGLMISASHNPYEDNGIKVFGPEGFKLSDDKEHGVEQNILSQLQSSVTPRRAALAGDAALAQRYVDHLVQAGAPAAELKKLRLIVDCSHGAASRFAAAFFESLGMQTEVCFNEPNGRNINLDCGSLHLEKLRQRVLDDGADLGVAFDGDADRALFIADDGAVVDGDVVLLLAGELLKAQGCLPGDRLVTTIMANMGLEKALKDRGITMVRTQVGDKYVLEEMLSGEAAVGGEQSGHVIFKKFANTGDGMLTARKVIEILSASGAPLSELRKKLVVFPQKLVNVKVSRKPPIADVPVVAAAIAAAEAELGDRGRIVVRYSGTEQLARVMVEAESQEDVERYCSQISTVFQQELGV
jgi:phosphoglucosamine mutase